jgi:hypothetical protein
MTTAVSQQSPQADGDSTPSTEDRRHMIRRRWLTAVIIVLLIGIPAGYLVIAAEQSRNSGRHNEKKALATGLTHGWPSTMQRRIFDVPIPERALGVWCYQTSNWKVSRLYVQFTTDQAGVDEFLKDVGVNPTTLQDGKVTVRGRDARIVGWKFPGTRDWSGSTFSQKEPLPTVNITVDSTLPHARRVYVVSTDAP